MIYYSQCWEDPKILSEVLAPKPGDHILSISSGGDNTLYLALFNPQRIVALDVNPAQNYLLELKLAGISKLSYEEWLRFIGVIPSKERERIFEFLSPCLSSKAEGWWRQRIFLIREGVIHIGKLERYLRKFRKWILPAIHPQKRIEELASLKKPEEQIDFYYNTWNTWKWRFVFKVFCSKPLLRRFGRNPDLFTFLETEDIGTRYLERVERALIVSSIEKNYFLQYILRGGNMTGAVLPPYLRQENFELLKERISCISVVTDSIYTYLKAQRTNEFTKANLSDVFEGMSVQESEKCFSELGRVLAPRGRLAYWTNLVERFPSEDQSVLKKEKEREQKARTHDKVFFYEGVHCYSVTKVK